MVIGKSGKGIFQPLLDLKTNRVLFFLVKMGAGLLLGLLLIFYRPIIETRITHITHPEAGAETIPARPQDLASREDIVVPELTPRVRRSLYHPMRSFRRRHLTPR